MISQNITNQYLDAGKNLTLLNGKIPKIENWTKNIPSDDEVLSYKGNLGWVLGKSDLVIDVDPKNGGEESFKKLKQFLLANQPLEKLVPTVSTPSGGFHIYLSIPALYNDQSFKKTLNKEYPGIDFLTEGAQCVITGSKTKQGEYQWFDDLLGAFEVSDAPETILDLISYNNAGKTFNRDLGDFEGLVGGSSTSFTEDVVSKMLSYLDPSMPNNEWVKVGMALHDWDPVRGLEFWENWSLEGENYKAGETEKRWRSFDLGGGVTLGTISYMVKEVEYDEKSSTVNAYLKKIKSSNEKVIEFELANQIKREDLNPFHREKLALTIRDRIKDLSGVRMPINEVRYLITNPKVAQGELVEDDEIPFWCKHWVYVNTHSGFMNLDTLTLHKSESFNLENGKYIPAGDGGFKCSASKYVADRGIVRKVDTLAYLPSFDKVICKLDGLTVLNSFNPRTIPNQAKHFTPNGELAIKYIKEHIKFICTSDENADILTQWIAHQVQFPGQKILWSPVIQSIQGVGKSFFGELLRHCLGDRNVGTVSPTQVTSDFNSWATNVVVNVLEELRVKGHNRFDAVNALKPLITDRMIQINEKGVKQFMTYNTTNYICFTNYKDSLPLSEDDRRWWVLFVQIEDLKELEFLTGVPTNIYFPRLFNSLRENPSEVKKWLMEYEITEEFKNTMQAPMTDYKQIMIATEETGHEGLLEAKEAIMEGGKYWNPICVSSSDLFESIMFDNPEIELNNNKRNQILKRLGFNIVPKRVKIDGKARKIWSKKPMTNDEIRSMFDRTVLPGDVADYLDTMEALEDIGLDDEL